MFSWGSEINKLNRNKEQQKERDVLKFKNIIEPSKTAKTHEETPESSTGQLYDPFIHIESTEPTEETKTVLETADPIYDDISVVLKKDMDICDFYYDFNNSPTIESIINKIKIRLVEAPMGHNSGVTSNQTPSDVVVKAPPSKTTQNESITAKQNSTQYKILYSGFAGKFCSYTTTKTKLLLCIPVKIFEVMKSGDFFKINYKNCNECEFVYKTATYEERPHEDDEFYFESFNGLDRLNTLDKLGTFDTREKRSNFIEFTQDKCVLSLCDVNTNADIPAELSRKYICYEIVCESGANEPNSTEALFACLSALYEHCKNVYYCKIGNYAKNTYKSVVSGKYLDHHELLWNEPICRVLNIWNDVNYALYINRDVFNAVYVMPEHKLTNITLGTFKCNPTLITSTISCDGLAINAQDYLVKFSSKDNNFNETAETRVVYLLTWVSDVIKHKSNEHAKKYSNWMQIYHC